jgi:hypothetical protein
VSGGEANFAYGESSTIGGGNNNYTDGDYATIAGGQNNWITSTYGTIGGGSNNLTTGIYATIPGGYQNTASGDYSFAAGQNASANHQGSFVWADRYITTTFSTDRNNQYKVRSYGGSRFEDGAGLWVELNYSYPIETSTGAYLDHTGVWTNSSDRSKKENFSTVDNQLILERLVELPITDWNYIVDDDSVRHIGPVAQDFYAAFQLGDNEKAIGTIDGDGVALAAIQGLYSRVVELERENNQLQQQIENMSGNISTNKPHTIQILVYVLVVLVLILLVGFCWIIFKLKSFVTGGV